LALDAFPATVAAGVETPSLTHEQCEALATQRLTQSDQCLLPPDFLLFFAHRGQAVRVDALGEKYDGWRLADPLEPTYRDGTDAVFHWRHGDWLINSFAHGIVRTYRPVPAFPPDPDEADMQDLLQRASSPSPDGQGDSPPRKLGSADGSRLGAQLARDYEGRLAFSLDDQRWYAYQADSGIWTPQPLVVVRARVRESIAGLERGATFAWSLASDVEKFLQTHLYTTFPRPGGHLVPFANTVVDLHTMTEESHDPTHSLRWHLPYAYDAQATCPTVQRWLKGFVHGDEHMVQVLRAYARAVVCGRTDLRRFLALVGPAGSGKSTYVRFLQALVGMQNTTTTEIRQLEPNRFELSGLISKRLIILADVGHYMAEVNTLKALTGGDALRVETKNVDRKDTPSVFCEGMVVIASEHAVQSTDYSAGLETRRITIPTRGRVSHPASILDYDRERGTFSGLLVPELPGVFPWLFAMTDVEMERTLQYATKGHPSLRKAQVDAIMETNPLMRWAEQTLALWTTDEHAAYTKEEPGAPAPLCVGVARRCDRGVNAYECEKVWLYPSYRRYADDTGVGAISLQRFKGLLANLLTEQLRLPGVEEFHDKKGSQFRGVRFRTLDDEKEGSTTRRLSEIYTQLVPGDGR
jgi:putative DNA primase/helicase